MSKPTKSTMSKVATPLGIALLLGTVTGPAWGEEKVAPLSPSRDQFYVFDDDPLDAVGMADRTARVRARRGAGRVLLIRPRAHFIPELTRSVERL